MAEYACMRRLDVRRPRQLVAGSIASCDKIVDPDSEGALHSFPNANQSQPSFQSTTTNFSAANIPS